MAGTTFSVLLRGALTAVLAFASASAQEEEPQKDGDYYALRLEDGVRRLRKGELSSAEAILQDLLDAFEEEAEGDRPAQALVAEARILLLDIGLRRGEYEAARDGFAALPPPLRDRRDVVLLRAAALRRLGAYGDAIALLQGLADRAAADREARHELGEALHADGRRRAARAQWQQNADGGPPDDPVQLAFYGRSLWRLGGRANFEASSRALVDSMQRAPDRPEARTTLGILKFEAYGEAAGFPSGEKDLLKVLETNGDDEAALLALYRLRSANQALDAGKTERFLDRVLERNRRCVDAIVFRAANVLDDRRYGDAAELLDEALATDPNHRIALCHRAAAAHLMHDRAAYDDYRRRALAGDAGWAEPDRILGDHLVALYRFADALPFYAAAREADSDHVETLHGMARALVFTGEGVRAKELLSKAKDLEPGFVDPWRNNALAVQQLLDAEYTVVEHERFKLQIHRDDVEVLQAYLMPIHLEAAAILGAKYGWQPDVPTRVEVFHTWDDFSVRTIGFRGFTALGACFGRLITLVSPVDADLRRQDFMWEATAWHEYAHVLTLGLSKHRVPRWLTEGFSVYEETQRDRAWERGMDRELFDAFHNRDIPPVRLLNRLFRGPRILFGYLQGGLIVERIAQRHGFARAIELLRAFGDDLDTEAAFDRALGVSSSAFDKELLDFVQHEKLRGMRLVPRYDDAAMGRLAGAVAADATNLQARVDLAWACVQRDNPVDAGRWLAEVLRADAEHGGALLVRAELLRRRKDLEGAADCWRRGFARGADDFDSRIAFGDALRELGDDAGAIEQWQRAKGCWPACTEQENAPELRLARLYRDQGDATKAQMEMKSYCRRTARAFTPRWSLATFAREAGNRAEEAQYLVECNRIDPFHRELHVRLGEAFEALGKRAQAALEFEVAAAVAPHLDRRYLAPDAERPEADAPDELTERGELVVRAAKLRHALGDAERARELLDRALRIAPASPAADEARRLQQEWPR
jgi:tetratricopeptide (TPR) repeat protein